MGQMVKHEIALDGELVKYGWDRRVFVCALGVLVGLLVGWFVCCCLLLLAWIESNMVWIASAMFILFLKFE
jgi:hypothetical protein